MKVVSIIVGVIIITGLVAFIGYQTYQIIKQLKSKKKEDK